MTVADQQLLSRLTEVFRRYGYEGASLSALSSATGLARASLYHRFPRGKSEMAEYVMRGTQAWLREQALAPLRDTSLRPAERVRAMARQLDAFYGSGTKSCVLDALSIGEAGAPLRRLVRGALDLWSRDLAATVRAAGFTEREAAARAERALTLLQGALVVARVRSDPAPFQRVIDELPEVLLGR